MVEVVRAFDDGWRIFLVVAEGPRWTSMIDLGSLRHNKIETAKFRREMKPEQLDIPAESALKRLRRRRKMFKRSGCTWSPVVDAVLREEAHD